MALFNRPTPPSPQKSSFGGILGERLFGGQKPTPKPEQKPQTKPGLLGPTGYSSFREQKQFAIKAPYEPLPGTVQKLGKKERGALVDELQERARRAGQTYGLSEEKYRTRVAPQIKKDIYQLRIQGKINEAKQLERKTQYWEKLIKGS